MWAVVTAIGSVLSWLARLGPWLIGLLPAFFNMLGITKTVARIVGISVNVAIAVGVAAVLPMPSWLTGLPGQIALLPATFFWFASMVQLKFCVTVVASAYVLRWVWRILTKPS